MARIPTLDDDDTRRARRLRLGRAGLDSLMRDERYWDGGHPDHEALVELVRQGFELVFKAAPARPGGRERPPFATPPIAPPLPGTRQAPRDAFAEYVAELESDAEGIDALSAKEQEALGRSAVLQAIRGSGHRLPPGFDEDGAKAFPGIRSLPARGNEDATLRHTVVRDDSPSLEIRPRDAQTAQAEGADQPPVEATSLAPEEWEKIIGNILKREGLFNPRDPSMRGIKDTTLQEILRRRGEVPSPEEFDQRLRNLSEAEAREIYHIIREEAQLTRLPDAELAEQVFDGVVNQGQGDGIKQLQSALNKVTGSNLVVDGALGSRTQRAVGAAIASGRLRDVRRQIVEERIAKIDSLKDSESDKAVLRQRARDVGPR